MKQAALTLYHSPYLTVIGLMIFFTLFIAVTLWVSQKSRKPLYDHLANLPLSEEQS